MADTREIKIVLETVNGSSGADGSGNESERADTKAAAETTKSSGSSQGKAAAKVLATMAIQAVANETTAWISYNINKELNLNDDYIGQRNLNIANQAVNWSVSSATTIASAAMMGAQFGPIGAAVGAVLGVGMVAAKTARANIEAMDQQNIMINKMNAQLDFTRQRSGFSLEAASIGENL